MGKFSLLFISIMIFGFNILAAQPKIVFNTNYSKDIRVRPGDTMQLEITVGNYGNAPISDNYRISAYFNPTEGFLSSTRYVLSPIELSGIPLGINQQKQFTFKYLIPEDAPEVSQNLIFTAFDEQQSLHIGGGYLFLRINIESRDPLPDLAIQNYRFPRIQSIYTKLPLQFEVINKGELLSFEPTNVNVYLSSSGTLDAESVFMESYVISPLVVGNKITIKDTLKLETISPAVYRVIIVVDQENIVRENDEINNIFNFSFPYPINGNNFPDLFFSTVNSPREMFINDPTANQKIRTVIWNQTRPRDITPINISTPICNHIYLSRDNQLDGNDCLLGTASLPNGIGANLTEELIFTPNACFGNLTDTPLFPNDIEAGDYYLIIVLDTENEVIEYFENNNTLFRRVRLSRFNNNFFASKSSIGFSFYPNPVNEHLLVRYENKTAERAIPFSFYDAGGKVFLSGKWESVVGQNQQELNLSTIEQGIYFLKIGETVQRIVVIK